MSAQNKANGRAAKEARQKAAADRLARSKPCTVKGCKSVHVEGHK